MFDLIITPTEIKREQWVYDDEIEEGAYQYDKVEDLAVHLGSTIKFEGKITFERIFDLILENTDLYNLVFHSQMGGYAIEAFIEDYNSKPTAIDDDLEFLEIYASGDSITYYDDTKDLSFGVDFHGWGKWSEETGMNNGPISIGFSSLADYRKLELKLKENAMFGVTPKKVTTADDCLKYEGGYSYSWYDIVSSILYEISWYGTPKSRDANLKDLKERVDEVNEAIESKDDSFFIPLNDIDDLIDKGEDV